MSNSVRQPAPARQASPYSPAFQVSALSLVSATVIHSVAGQGVPWIVVVILVMVVVAPAVWSRKGYRRQAALDALGTILRWDR